MIRVLGLVLLLALSAGEAWGENLYVRPSGGSYGAADGLSYATAFNGLANVQFATSDTAGKVDADDTLYVCGASSGEKLSLSTAAGEGTSGHPITIDCRCGPASDPAVITETGTQSQGIVLGAGVDYVTLIGCKVRGPTNGSGDPEASIATLDGVGIIMTDVEASGNTAATGIRLRKCQACTVTRPVSFGNKNHGIAVLGDAGRNATDIVIDSPLTYSNRRTGVLVSGSTTATDVQRVKVINPVSYGNGDGLYMIKATSVEFYGTWPGACSVHDNTNTADALAEGYGVGHQQSVNGSTYLCDIVGNRSDGLEIWGDASIPSTGARAWGNFVSGHTNAIADDTAGNGIECRTGYSTCDIYSNILVGNRKGLRLGNSPSGTSYAVNNDITGGVYSMRLVDSNEVGTNAVTGWVIDNNNLCNPTSYWLFTDVTASNSNTFAKNNFCGTGQAVYNSTTYSSTTVSAVDSTRLDNVSPAWAGGASPLTRQGFRLLPSSSLPCAGTNVGRRTDALGRGFEPNCTPIGAMVYGRGDARGTALPARP